MAKKLGKLTVEIEADSDRLETSTKKAKSELKDVGDQGGRSGKSVSAGFDRVGTKIQNSTEGVRKFTSSLTETVGIVTGIVGVFGTLTAVIAGAVSKAKEFNKNLESTVETSRKSLKGTLFDTSNLKDVDRELAKIRQKRFDTIQTLEESLPTGFISEFLRVLSRVGEETTGNTLNVFGIESTEKEIEKIEKARERIRSLSKQEIAAVETEFRERAEKQFAERARKIRISLIDDEIEKIKERTQVEIDEATKAAENAGAEDTKRFRELILQIEARRDAEIEAARDVAEAKEKIEDQKRRERIQKDKEAAKAAAEALRRELSGVADSLFGDAGGNFTTRLDTLINEVRNATNAIGRRP